jgi:putative spermidine/putrescine transport system ATP-binding protein
MWREAAAEDAGKASASPATLAVSEVRKSYGDVTALEGVSLSVAEGELVTLLGPSGSGKTTLLKAIAGFEEIDDRRITLGGQDITELASADRNIGMVFQNYALFPHLTVAQNIAFPLEMRRIPRKEIRRRVEEALALVELVGYGRRLPRELSGGQQQRVALARATVFNPGLLLLDEPFSALDRKLRETMQIEVRRLQRRLKLTTVFVTHDQEEALLLSDRIAVMSNGRIEQFDAPAVIYENPANYFVAGFVGDANLLRGTLDAGPDGTPEIRTERGERILVDRPLEARIGAQVQLLVRPERLRWLQSAQEAENAFPATIVEHLYLGQDSKYRVRLPSGLELILRMPSSAETRCGAIGESRLVGWDARYVRVFA